jgi:Leucine-rich repeat (LRR) protein
LDLSFNRLESLPSEIYDLPLEHLLVNDNLLTSLPPCDDVPSHRMQNIITLNISNNSISHIPSFGLFISVEKLYGSKNKISLLDAGVGVLLTMTVLDLSYNEITEVPSHLLTHLLTYSSTYLLTHSLT